MDSRLRGNDERGRGGVILSALFGVILITAALASPAFAQAPASAPTGKPHLPPFLLYQTRGLPPTGDRLAKGRDGERLFSNKCGACHLIGGMGTNLLTKQRVAAGLSAEGGLLATRTDLTVDYVKAVARNGYLAMPRISRVEVTDPELDTIAAYLAKGKK